MIGGAEQIDDHVDGVDALLACAAQDGAHIYGKQRRTAEFDERKKRTGSSVEFVQGDTTQADVLERIKRGSASVQYGIRVDYDPAVG